MKKKGLEYKVVVASKSFGTSGPEPEELIQEAGGFVERLTAEKRCTEDDLVKAVGDAAGLIVGMEPVSRRVLQAAPKLRVVAKHGVGVDNIDLEAATEKGIVVAFTPGSNASAVAELAVGQLFNLARGIVTAHQDLHTGEWRRVQGIELFGKTLGIIGFGTIGMEVAKRATGLGMKVIAYDVAFNTKRASELDVEEAPMEKLLRVSDFVTIHVGLSEKTRGMIGEAELSMMKDGAYLINTARGPLIDEQALYRHLKQGHLAGAALDVFASEPVTADHPLLTLKNVTATPHMGANTRESIQRMSMGAARAVSAVLKGKLPEHVANTEVLSKIR